MRRGPGWEKFSNDVDTFIKNLEQDGGAIETEDILCTLCSEIFNTKNSFKEHEKVHNQASVRYSCNKCEDKFVVDTHFKNHILSHQLLYYSKLKDGRLRCNVCSQH